MSEGDNNNVIDYTAAKLERLINEVESPVEQETVMAILDGYYLGVLGISWEGGFPMVIPLVSKTGEKLRVLPPRCGALGYDSYGKLIKEEEVEQGD